MAARTGRDSALVRAPGALGFMLMMRVCEVADEVRAAVKKPSRGTYKTGIDRLVAAIGNRDLDEVRLTDLERLRDSIQESVGLHIVQHARETGRRLRAYDADAHGNGAAENFVWAARFFFRYTKVAGYVKDNPAAELRPPRRPPAPERPLTAGELQQIWTVVATSGADRALDTRLLTFLRHTAARREGCLNLAVDHLDPNNGEVTLTEKFGHTRTLPLDSDVGRDLLAFAHYRGADGPGSPVFRLADGTPITRRRFQMIFNRVDRHLGWTEPLDVGPHWIRHTTLADIAAVSDDRVAAAFAGHAPETLGTIGRYTKVTFDDLRDAYEAVFGASEPIGRMRTGALAAGTTWSHLDPVEKAGDTE